MTIRLCQGKGGLFYALHAVVSYCSILLHPWIFYLYLVLGKCTKSFGIKETYSGLIYNVWKRNQLQHTCTLWDLWALQWQLLCHGDDAIIWFFFLFASDSRNQNICLSFLQQPDLHWTWQPLSLSHRTPEWWAGGCTVSRVTQPQNQNITHIWLFTLILIVICQEIAQSQPRQCSWMKSFAQPHSVATETISRGSSGRRLGGDITTYAAGIFQVKLAHDDKALFNFLQSAALVKDKSVMKRGVKSVN